MSVSKPPPMTGRRIVTVLVAAWFVLVPSFAVAGDLAADTALYRAAVVEAAATRTDDAYRIMAERLSVLLAGRLDAARAWAHAAAVAAPRDEGALYMDDLDASLSAVIAARQSGATVPVATLLGTYGTLTDDVRRVTYAALRTVWEQRRDTANRQLGTVIRAVDAMPAGETRTRLHEGLAAAQQRLNVVYGPVAALPTDVPTAGDPRLVAARQGMEAAAGVWVDLMPLLAETRTFLALPASD